MAQIVIELDPGDGRIDASGNVQSAWQFMPLNFVSKAVRNYTRDNDRRVKVWLHGKLMQRKLYLLSSMDYALVKISYHEDQKQGNPCHRLPKRQKEQEETPREDIHRFALGDVKRMENRRQHSHRDRESVTTDRQNCFSRRTNAQQTLFP